MDFEKMLDLYPPEGLPEEDEDARSIHTSPRKLKQMKHQAELDLHGFTEESALQELSRFLQRSSSQGLKKVLIIFGKGYHSDSRPVLPGAVRRYLESSPLAGQLTTPPPKYGGSGALWVLIRKG